MNTKKGLILILIIISLMVFSACQGRKINLDELPQETGTTFLMDTLIQMKVYGENAGEVIDESFARLREIEREMSVTLADSEIYRINTHTGKFIDIGEDTYRVLKKALDYAELTGGRFDPSIGPLVQLWGIGTEKARVPSRQEINKAIKLVDYRLVETDDKNTAVRLPVEGMRLDLGAIAKGFAADEVRKIILSRGIKSAYVNLGGNVLVVGGKPDGSPWKVGIQDPREERGNIMASIEVKDKTIVTSGNYERYFKKDGVIYHHIIDPQTGYPARSGIISASIITKDSFDADALSTSVFILGPEKGMELIKGLEGVEAMIITNKLEVLLSEGLRGKIKILNSDFKLIGK